MAPTSPRPSRVRFTNIACYLEDKQADRVQELGSTTNLTTEDIFELSNLNKAEIVDDVPTVDVALNTNEYGSNTTIGMLADVGYGCQCVAMGTMASAGTNQINLWKGGFPYNGEIISFSGSGPITLTSGQGTWSIGLNPNPVTATGNNRWMIVTGTGALLTAGYVQLATYSATAANVVTQAFITDQRIGWSGMTHLNFEYARVAIAAPMRQSGTATITRTMYMDNCFVDKLDATYQTKGAATENVTLETDNKRWFLNSAANVKTDYFLATAAQTSFVLSAAPVQLANYRYTLRAYQDGIEIGETAPSGTGAFGVVGSTLTLTTPATAGDILKVRYITSSAAAWPTPVTVIGQYEYYPGAVKEGQVEIYLNDNLGAFMTRCQSVTISVPFQRDVMQQLGAMKPYDRPLNIPIELTVSLEFIDSDLQELVRFTNQNAVFGTITQVDIMDLVKTMGCVIKVYKATDLIRGKEPAGHPDQYPIRTITINNLVPTSEKWDIKVKDNASQTFDFRTDNIAWTDRLL